MLVHADKGSERIKMLKTTLTLAAIYQAIVGVGTIFLPRRFGVDAVPADASPALIEFLRIYGGPMLGIAVMNWMTRSAEPSKARNAIVVANIVGFGCVALMDVRGVFGGDARSLAKLFLVVHSLFTVAFVVSWRASRRVESRIS